LGEIIETFFVEVASFDQFAFARREILLTDAVDRDADFLVSDTNRSSCSAFGRCSDDIGKLGEFV
jgi:hypothetical protein